VNGDGVDVLEGRSRASFPEKSRAGPPACVGCLLEIDTQELESDGAFELHVASAVDLPHPTETEQSFDRVPIEDVAGPQMHGSSQYTRSISSRSPNDHEAITVGMT
jgi:hypothetical protein